MSDFKQPQRVVQDKEGWERLRRAKLGPCRVCGDAWLPTLHHLVSRSLGGDDVAENLVPLCGTGTTGCHGRVEAREHATLAVLREKLEREEVAYVLMRKGLPFLDRYYPRSAA